MITIAALSAGYWIWRKGRNSGSPVTIFNNPMVKNYFSDSELIASSTAKKYGLDNTPTAAEWSNLFALRDNILNPAREQLNSPIFVNSGYRSEALNNIVGGAANSQHRTGEAVDITAGSPRKNKELFAILVQMGNFDQLIWEKGGEWIHVSYRDGGRGQMLSYDGSKYYNINNNWQIAIV